MCIIAKICNRFVYGQLFFEYKLSYQSYSDAIWVNWIKFCSCFVWERKTITIICVLNIQYSIETFFGPIRTLSQNLIQCSDSEREWQSYHLLCKNDCTLLSTHVNASSPASGVTARHLIATQQSLTTKKFQLTQDWCPIHSQHLTENFENYEK